MPVNTIVSGVERAVLIPFDRDITLVARVLDLAIGLDPSEPLALLAPEFRRVGDRFLVELLVFRLVDPGAGRDRGRDGNGAGIRHGDVSLMACGQNKSVAGSQQ